MSSPEADLALLIEVADEGGAIAMRHFRTAMRRWEKDAGAGPVTEADLAVDAHLRQRLLAARPDYGWLSEETADSPERLDRDRIFIVDPIDGTRAFIDGTRGWCIALAVVQAGRVEAAVALLPALGKRYTAIRGGGAFCDGKPIAPSQRSEPLGALVLAGAAQMDARHWPGSVPAVQREWRPSLVNRLCRVGQGVADAALTFRPAWEWDIAAGALIAAEAGCTVTDGQGQTLCFNGPRPRLPGVIVAPPALHAALLHRRLGYTAGR